MAFAHMQVRGYRTGANCFSLSGAGQREKDFDVPP
jgi:hypothetical protein